MFNSPEDRALSEHRGSGIFVKKSSGKYSLLLPVEGTGENGSTPAQLDKTAIGNLQASSVEGRAENPQKTMPFFAHRDNINILEKYKGQKLDFLRILPDFTGIKYSGTITYMLNNTDVGALEQGQITITPNTKDEYVQNCYPLIEDTVIFTNSIDEVVEVAESSTAADHTKVIDITTNPADATVTALSESSTYATATYSNGKVTITGVAEGSAIVTLNATKTGYASFDRTILVIVK